MRITKNDKICAILLASAICIFIAFFAMQIFLPEFYTLTALPGKIIDSTGEVYLLFAVKLLLFLAQLVISVELVLRGREKGFQIQLVVNIIEILFCIQAFILQKSGFMFVGSSISAATIVICFILRKHILQRESDFTDELTGLPNRQAAHNIIEDYIFGTEKLPSFTLILMEIEDFDFIKCYLGYSAGDAMIIEVSKRISVALEKESKTFPAVVFHTSSVEFSIIVQREMSESETLEFIERINERIKFPFKCQDKEFKVSANYGITFYPKNSISSEELEKQAEIALLRAKSKGLEKIAFFDEKSQEELKKQLDMGRRLSQAIENKEIYLEFQPQFFLPDEHLRGFEVLARWKIPGKGNVEPSDFIPLAESNGLIIQLGKWIIREACNIFQTLLASYKEPVVMSINISVIQFQDPDFISYVKQIIKETDMDPAYLEFEVTESIFINSLETAKHILNELKELGIKISLDDFGTGYSSLSYLRNLPFDVIKIDKSFIDSIGIIPDEKNIVKTIIDMAHQLELEVIAEGIVQKNQFDYLVENGCDIVQGNYSGRPLPKFAL